MFYLRFQNSCKCLKKRNPRNELNLWTKKLTSAEKLFKSVQTRRCLEMSGKED